MNKQQEEAKALEEAEKILFKHVPSVINLGSVVDAMFEFAKWQQSQQPSTVMTLEECKKQIAWENGYKSIDEIHDRVGHDLAYQLLDQAAELYANQFRK